VRGLCFGGTLLGNSFASSSLLLRATLASRFRSSFNNFFFVCLAKKKKIGHEIIGIKFFQFEREKKVVVWT
jgi:hypothetical protein